MRIPITQWHMAIYLIAAATGWYVAWLLESEVPSLGIVGGLLICWLLLRLAGQPRFVHQARWIGACALTGMGCGCIANVVNAWISPDYFIHALNLWNTAYVSHAVFGAAIREGLLEGSLLGFGIGIVIVTIHRKSDYSRHYKIAVIRQAVIIAVSTSLIFGLSGALYTLAWGLSDRATMAGGFAWLQYIVRFSLVEWAVTGWYLGAVLVPLFIWWRHRRKGMPAR